ncbi:MAG: hypothetical protein AAF611_17515 [Bacteroidota bacterium]
MKKKSVNRFYLKKESISKLAAEQLHGGLSSDSNNTLRTFLTKCTRCATCNLLECLQGSGV